MTAPEHHTSEHDTASLPGEPDDQTACQDTLGNIYLVELHERAAEVVFATAGGQRVRSYSFGTFAGVNDALALDLGRGLVIDATTVAALQQWANLDEFGLRERLRQERGVVASGDIDPDTAAHLASALADLEGRRP
ncbi:hypothetical protein [Actinoplanes sp. NPDC049118]|uniref:hypothetical protein n=1 Tax=Actinoplanes sp. NPDC049118 TaxID=3155769 RepID=UPI0033F70FFB